MYALKLVYLNVTFYLLLVVFTALCVPVFALCLVVLSLFVSKRRVERRLRRFVSWYGWTTVRIFPFPLVRIEFVQDGKGGIRGGRLFVCNHRSLSDPWLMGLLPYEAIQIAKAYTLRIPILGIVARLAGYLSATELSHEELSKKMRELLDNGVSIITFPEGTRSGSGRMGQFHSAVFRVALEARCPVVPLCIAGNERIPARGSLLLRPGRIRVHELPALHWEAYRGLSAFALKNRVRNILRKHIENLERQGARAS